MNGTRTRTKEVWVLALLACVMLLAALVGGCKASSTTSTTPQNQAADKKAMIEAVAKWYAAQGNLDIAGYKAGIYDPKNILGVATMTAPPAGAKKTVVKWVWVGDNAVITMPAQQTTITVSASPTETAVVNLKDALGETGLFVMKNDNGVWKIDIAATQSKSAANSGAAPTTSAP